MKVSASLIAIANGKTTGHFDNRDKIFGNFNFLKKKYFWKNSSLKKSFLKNFFNFWTLNFEKILKFILAGTIDLFGAQRTTEMNTPDAPFCINCSDATLGQFPWQLSLQTTGHFCGGSILSATALSTAAHCRKSSYYAVAGTIDNQSGQKIQTNTFIGHPQYNGSKIINDFAVGKVRDPRTKTGPGIEKFQISLIEPGRPKF